MKRYLLFLSVAYDEKGGWNDFAGDFDSIVGAALKAKEIIVSAANWWHVVDLTTGTIVARSLLSSPASEL